jgi:hypothetical protein
MNLYEPTYYEPNGRRTADCDGPMTWDDAISTSRRYPRLTVMLRSHSDGRYSWLRAGRSVPAPDWAETATPSTQAERLERRSGPPRRFA